MKRWEKVSVDGLISCAVSSKLTAIHQLVFVYMKTQYVNYSKNPKDTVWDNHERENHKTVQDVNEMIVRASNDTGNACYGVAKFAQIC